MTACRQARGRNEGTGDCDVLGARVLGPVRRVARSAVCGADGLSPYMDERERLTWWFRREQFAEHPVKRSYDNDARRAGSEKTRTRILEVAFEIITTHGYRAATIAKIARASDVRVDTIYALIGRKPALLNELIERSISGTDRAVAPAQRQYVQQMRAEPDPARKLAICADAICEIHQRMAPLLNAQCSMHNAQCTMHYATRPRPTTKRNRYGGESATGAPATCTTSSGNLVHAEHSLPT